MNKYTKLLETNKIRECGRTSLYFGKLNNFKIKSFGGVSHEISFINGFSGVRVILAAQVGSLFLVYTTQ